MVSTGPADWWEDLEREVLECLADTPRATPRDLGRKLGMSERAVVSLVSQLAVAGKLSIALVEPPDAGESGLS